MVRADFYLLAGGDPIRFVCQLTEKIWKQGNQIYIHAESMGQVDRIDQLLWTYRDISFLPHVKVSNAIPSPILIGYGNQVEKVTHREVLINIRYEIAEEATSFARIVEVVGNDEATRHAARLRYRHYRDYQIELHQHEIRARL